MEDLRTDRNPDLIMQVPDPDTVWGWLVESTRRRDLLRSLRRVAMRKTAHRRPAAAPGAIVAGQPCLTPRLPPRRRARQPPFTASRA